ncbi:MAG TPA: hypothetical protein VGM22_08365 [Methylomirabilota bacterium]
MLGGTVVFAAAQAAHAALGVRFAGALPSYHEYVDPVLLRTRLLESLTFLPSQPPVFNLFLGLVLKAFPAAHLVVLEIVYRALGLGLFLLLLALMRRVGVSTALALALGTVFVAAPAFVLYECQPFYMLPLAFLLTASVALGAAAARRPAGPWLVAFFAAVVLLALTHALFHLVYVLLAGLALVAAGVRLRRAARAAAAPLGILVAVYLKNALLFGTLTLSAWTGMHLWDMTVGLLPEGEARRLVAEGRLSPVALDPQFSDPERYPPEMFASNP